MYFTLTATSGPHVGKVLNLPADGTARVGRGEQADFSFPEDLNMSTNHFLIEARPTCGLLTDLKSTNGTFVNGEPVDEAIVANGDEIFAGETTFAVSLSASIKTERRESVRAPQLSLDMPATAVCDGLQLTEECQPLIHQDQTAAQLIDALTRKKLYADALRVLSRAMGTPAALLWSCTCIEEAQPGKLTPAELHAIQAAKNWVAKPSPAHAAEAHCAAEALNNEGPAAMLAIAAFWGAGSLVPPGQPVIPVDPQLPSQSISGALTLVAVDGPPKEAAAKYETFIRKAFPTDQ